LPEIPPCDNQSEASSKTSKVSCKKRKRKSCISNLFSDSSDDDDDNTPKKLYIQMKSPSDHTSSSKSQVDISESSDEESSTPPIKLEPKDFSQTDLDKVMIVSEEEPALKSLGFNLFSKFI
jgi:hypothetical protein